jgi:hypothetical protein
MQAMTDTLNEALPQRKRPVHMPPVERHNEPAILFVTKRLRAGLEGEPVVSRGTEDGSAQPRPPQKNDSNGHNCNCCGINRRL